VGWDPSAAESPPPARLAGSGRLVVAFLGCRSLIAAAPVLVVGLGRLFTQVLRHALGHGFVEVSFSLVLDPTFVAPGFAHVVHGLVVHFLHGIGIQRAPLVGTDVTLLRVPVVFSELSLSESEYLFDHLFELELLEPSRFGPLGPWYCIINSVRGSILTWPFAFPCRF